MADRNHPRAQARRSAAGRAGTAAAALGTWDPTDIAEIAPSRPNRADTARAAALAVATADVGSTLHDLPWMPQPGPDQAILIEQYARRTQNSLK
ncbi:hypothetical protein MMAGJ_39710 [Mycolicibacterium mageritense]|uniref:Uncharacterized protein n=1 Tax=Mycolicibacterium mageritense TaxID=53462 RepID=A0ABM7HVQ9_MYCME|nr:hypothetical protein MMAGJ_39710 [Mycolicibacterium mageritense]